MLTDLVTGPGFNETAPDPLADCEPIPDIEHGGANTEALVREKTNLIEQAIAPSGYL